MIWRVPRIWNEGECWILGGGPSVLRQFEVPDSVIQDVINKTAPLSSYSSYMAPLHNKHVIGINVAYLIGDWLDMVFFGDKGFYLAHRDQLAAYLKLKVSCHPEMAKVPWVKFLAKDTRHVQGISSNNGMVSWNGNSGGAAISLAVHTGAKRIILLGFDMKMDEKERQHFHSCYTYPLDKKKRMQSLPFHKHLPGFIRIAEDAKRMGIEIINASPESAIPHFPKVGIKELL